MKCLLITDPGETFEHWCDLDADHAGDHRCGDCGDVWNQHDDDRDYWEPHRRWDGTCEECVAERGDTPPARISSQAGLASIRGGIGFVTT